MFVFTASSPRPAFSKYLKFKVFLLCSYVWGCVIFTHIFILVSKTYGSIMNMKVYRLVKYACCNNSHSLFTQALLSDGSLRCYFNFSGLGIQAFLL